MNDFFIYYTESNIICLIIFAILLFHDLVSVDRQEKQIKYDHALVGFMLYFVSDTIWASVLSGVIPKTKFIVLAINFANFVLMASITYLWLRYALAVEQVPDREKRKRKIAMMSPFIASMIILIATYLIAPDVLIDENLDVKPIFNVFLIIVPCIYICASLIYSIKKARSEENAIEKRQYLYVGMFPLIVVFGGLLQVIVLPSTPVFCFSCTILMILFYMQSMDTQILTDPLTGLNNRGHLMKHISQMSSLHSEIKTVFIMMIDVNDFKGVNDTYGHAEGDRALIIIADSLRNASKIHDFPTFISRYGGDEFIIIAQTTSENEIKKLIEDIRSQIEFECETKETPYMLSVGIGYDEFLSGQDTIQKCIQRADKKLYLDKEYVKLHKKEK